MNMKKRNWIAGAIVLTAVIGGTHLWVNFYYNPLLFAVGSKVVRTSDWEPLKAKLFNGVYYSASDERYVLFAVPDCSYTAIEPWKRLHFGIDVPMTLPYTIFISLVSE
jgi:hypothetical protein